MVKDAALAWVSANCPDPKLRGDVERNLQDALSRGVNCWFVFGRDLCRRRVPFMLHCFAGELFVFQLTDGQTIAMATGPNEMTFGHEPGPLGPAGVEDPPVLLADLALEESVLPTDHPIRLSCRYEVPGEAPSAYCLRLDYSLGGRGSIVGWVNPKRPLGRSGALRPDFSRLGKDASPALRAYRGPVMMFLRVYSLQPVGDPLARQPLSNAVGTLAEFV